MKTSSRKIDLGNNIVLQVKERQVESRLEVSLTLQTSRECLLHWGVCRQPGAAWQLPPRSIWPADTRPFNDSAARTPFAALGDARELIISLEHDFTYPLIAFALFFPAENYWANNRGKNFLITLPPSGHALLSPEQILDRDTAGQEVVFRKIYPLAGERQLAAAVIRAEGRLRITIVADLAGPLILHWGVATRRRNEWRLPADSLRPAGTIIHNNSAARTPFAEAEGCNLLQLGCAEETAPAGLCFVLFQPETSSWIKDQHANFYIPLRPPQPPETISGPSELADLADEIIRAETGHHSWTLMHRFNLCHDLLDRVAESAEGLALLFVWLRFSAMRQLDWQRNYNTKPRELAHAQQRLTLKLAAAYRDSDPAAREVIRLMFSTLGRGGEGGKGQRIRDDILHIMHRHKIKEVSGHFMEEWHQKIHNNATPDDIVICEAYLAFLHSNGDQSVFYQTLEQNGVTRERLESFERPIVTAPDFVPYLKDGLIHDFENYLQLLKSIHSATDLASAVDHGLGCLDHDQREAVARLLQQRDDVSVPVEDRVRTITRVRGAMSALLVSRGDEECILNLLYLDLAMEEFLRVVVERQIHQALGLEQLTALTGMLIENVRFAHDIPELAICAVHWQRLAKIRHKDREWALHTRSVLERVSRILAAFGDHYYKLLQNKAELLGHGFQAEAWSIELFSQEIVRSGSAFVLSLLLSRLDPMLRATGHLGSWQIIGRADVSLGRVEVAALQAIQDAKFDHPVVLVSDRVTGDEEIPAGIVAILTPSTVDILSHLAVRARNGNCLFATCYDPKIIAELKANLGKVLQLTATAAGDVEFTESATQGPILSTPARKDAGRQAGTRLASCEFYALTADDFTDKVVGGKSYQLRRLRDSLPSWIRLPRSAALPFGVCEKALAEKANADIAERYNQLAGQVEQRPEEILPELRACLLALEPPPALAPALKQVMTAANLGWPEDWPILWMRIKQVWASKWNARAFRSRRIWGVDDADLFMAVLIQQVVAADYAFVIHTTNPFTGGRDELYAEVVPGLGETLCSGNYPGRALGFTCRKDKKLKPQLVSYPSKHVALKGGGLILRSDSNGEDLEEYAGAGLYDSVLMEPPRQELLDYTTDPLVWDKRFQDELMRTIAQIGIAVETALDDTPQDIEGACENGAFYVVQTRAQAGVG